MLINLPPPLRPKLGLSIAYAASTRQFVLSGRTFVLRSDNLRALMAIVRIYLRAESVKDTRGRGEYAEQQLFIQAAEALRAYRLHRGEPYAKSSHYHRRQQDGT